MEKGGLGVFSPPVVRTRIVPPPVDRPAATREPPMAEGDTLVRIARKLRPVMLEAEVAATSAPNRRSPLHRGAERFEGRTAERIETRGKHLLVHFSGGLSLHSHLGMNGTWRVDRGSGFGRSERTAWLLLELASAGGEQPSRVAQFGGPTLRAGSPAALANDPWIARLGPDILAPDFDPDAAAGRLRSWNDPVGVALLDQRMVCGIGNIFKSEGCFEARIDPLREAARLTGDEAVRLLETIRRQMTAAAETGRRPGRIYRKTGRPCPRCGTAEIRAVRQGDDARTTWFCPECQT